VPKDYNFIYEQLVDSEDDDVSIIQKNIKFLIPDEYDPIKHSGRVY